MNKGGIGNAGGSLGGGDEMPLMATATYMSHTYAGDMGLENNMQRAMFGQAVASAKLKNIQAGAVAPPLLDAIAKLTKGQTLTTAPRRLVEIIIVDTNTNVPLADAMLYSGQRFLTDLTDQELFWEIDVKAILAKHNEARIKFPDKAIKDRTVMLEPARVRDLKMTVVEIATF